MVELEELLYGDVPHPNWNEVAEFFKDGDFDEEHYLIEAIEMYLLTEEQRQLMFDNKISIEKMLNGRTNRLLAPVVNQIYEEWNTKLGFRCFRS